MTNQSFMSFIRRYLRVETGRDTNGKYMGIIREPFTQRDQKFYYNDDTHDWEPVNKKENRSSGATSI